MVDDVRDDTGLDAFYDRLNPWGPSDTFYLHLAEGAERVLDVGCGTGTLLHRLRAAGHRGRLVGLDPAPSMLDQARRHADVEWVQGYLTEAGFAGEFDLVVMTGHAFQVLLTDDDVRALLAAVHRALVPGGRFAFETRNPLHRAWESWTPDRVVEVRDDAGAAIRVHYDVEAVDGELVSLAEHYSGPPWPQPRVARSTLRFVPAEHLDALLTRSGFAIDERYGDWDRTLFTPSAREIITIASTR